MTGTEHYREAEKLIGRAWHFTYGDGADVAVGHAFATMAQVHATLALAAATALAPVREMPQREWPAWCAVAATKNSHLGETQEAGRPATVNETPAGARDLEGGASSLRHVEEGGAAGTRAGRHARRFECMTCGDTTDEPGREGETYCTYPDGPHRWAPNQSDVDTLRGLLDLMAGFSDNDQRARYLLTSNWMRDRDNARAATS